MKSLLRNISLFTLCLFLIIQLVPGASITGGFWTLLTAGIVLSLLFILLKPILSIISFPVNMITLGIFNIFINALLLYLLTIFVTEVSITAFTYDRMNFFGFITPVMTFNTFFAYLYAAFVLTLINNFIRWLME